MRLRFIAALAATAACAIGGYGVMPAPRLATIATSGGIHA